MEIDLEGLQPRIVFDALIHAIKTGEWGEIFYNSDPGHCVYQAGANGEPPNADLGEVPDDNEACKLLVALSSELGERAEPSIRTWQDFCQFAVESYKGMQGRLQAH